MKFYLVALLCSGLMSPMAWTQGTEKASPSAPLTPQISKPTPIPQGVSALDGDLIKAVLRKDRPQVAELLKKGANPNIDYAYQMAVIDVPETFTHPLLFAALGWRPIGADCFMGMKILARRIEPCDAGIVSALLEAGANVSWGQKEGCPIIDFAVRQSEPAVTALVLKHVREEARLKGQGFLVTAAGNNRVENVRLLLSRGVAVNERDQWGQTPLVAASEEEGKSQLATVALLLENGAGINLSDKGHRTALMQAAESGNPHLVAFLLQHKANVNARDDSGKTALSLATSGLKNVGKDYRRSFAEVVRLLRQANKPR